MLLGLLTGLVHQLNPSSFVRVHLATDSLQSAARTRCTPPPFSASSSFVPHCRLSLPTLNYRANHTRHFKVFVHSIYDGSTVRNNLQPTAYRFPKLASPISYTLSLRPTHYDADWFSFKTSLSWASLLDARSLAIRLQMLGWLLVLATIFDFFQRWASTCKLHLTGARVHHKSQDPQSGCRQRAQNRTHAQANAQRANFPSNMFTTTTRRIQLFDHMSATTNLMHLWLVSKLHDHTQVLANQLTSTWSVIRPRQQQIVLTKSGSLVPVPPLCQPSPMATPTPLPGFPHLEL